MKRESIYLDTSVISALYDDRVKERQEETKRFFKETILRYDIYVSNLTVSELDQTIDPVKKKEFKDFVKKFNLLKQNKEAESLAKDYIDKKVLSKSSYEDALHIAIASINKKNYLKDSVVKSLERQMRKKYPKDKMMFELKMLKAINSFRLLSLN